MQMRKKLVLLIIGSIITTLPQQKAVTKSNLSATKKSIKAF